MSFLDLRVHWFQAMRIPHETPGCKSGNPDRFGNSSVKGELVAEYGRIRSRDPEWAYINRFSRLQVHWYPVSKTFIKRKPVPVTRKMVHDIGEQAVRIFIGDTDDRDPVAPVTCPGSMILNQEIMHPPRRMILISFRSKSPTSEMTASVASHPPTETGTNLTPSMFLSFLIETPQSTDCSLPE